MSRKPKKGYFVRGHFVAEGSELDLELKRELKGGDAPSKTELRRKAPNFRRWAKPCWNCGAICSSRSICRPS